MIFAATAFAEDNPAENAESDEPYIYTSEDFKFTIMCPTKPIVIENPWQEPERRGEMLIFAYGDESTNYEVLYAYKIEVNAFKDEDVPDFNKGSMSAIGDYLLALKKNGGFATADLVNITKKNKGVYAVTPEKIDHLDENGEVIGEFIADNQYAFTFFRTPEGRAISIQLISANFNDKLLIDTYRAGVASFKDNIKSKAKTPKPKKSKKSKK